MTSVCETLRDSCKEIWHELHSHPFVAEMAAGTLPERKFAFYIGQNIVFLRELARAMALGVAKADDEDTMRDFAAIVSNIVDFEHLPDAPDHPVYRPWIEFFGGQEYWDTLDEVKAKLEGLCEGMSQSDLARIEDIFRTSSRLEQMFWDMAYNESAWSV